MTTTLLATDLSASILERISNWATLRLAYCPHGYSWQPDAAAFNGERLDSATGFYLLGNGYRGFNPTLMRFNSPDRLSPFSRGGINAYAYCTGDPINSRDPTGHFSALQLWKVGIGKVLLNIRSSKVDMMGRPTLLTARQRMDFTEGFAGVRQAGMKKSRRQTRRPPHQREDAVAATISDYLALKPALNIMNATARKRANAFHALPAPTVVDRHLSGPGYASLRESLIELQEIKSFNRIGLQLSSRGQGWFTRIADPPPAVLRFVDEQNQTDSVLRDLRARLKAIRQQADDA